MENGLIHIYTGDGKGKTSAALGLVIRALGAGNNILFTQFLKGQETSELVVLKKLGVKIIRTESVKKFIPYMNEQEKKICANLHKICYNKIKQLISTEEFDVLILDEIIPAINLGFIDINDCLTFLKSKPKKTEVVLTGRDAPNQLIQIADYVTDMCCLAHPYNAHNILARRGIEY